MEETNILVVEDEAITAMDIQKQLQKLGYKVPAIISSGEEAILMAEKLRPNLILMDIVLKGEIDGIVAAQRISNLYHIPVIFLTAYSDADTFNRAKSTLPYGYITKPFGLNELHMGVELALHKYKMETESDIETMRLKNEFLSNMTHEIRTPLNSIIGFTEMLHNGALGALSAEHREILGDILSSSRFLLQLLSDILELTQAQSKKIEWHPELINLTKIIQEVSDVNQENMKKTKNKLIIKIDPRLNDIVIDSEKLKQVLQHYLSNAIKFSHENGIIEICAYPENAVQFRIVVKDNGIGIGSENIHNLFVPFQQLETGMAKRFQGVGLGLALVRNIVEAQEGKVGVESKLGEGSEFYAIYKRIN